MVAVTKWLHTLMYMYYGCRWSHISLGTDNGQQGITFVYSKLPKSSPERIFEEQHVGRRMDYESRVQSIGPRIGNIFVYIYTQYIIIIYICIYTHIYTHIRLFRFLFFRGMHGDMILEHGAGVRDPGRKMRVQDKKLMSSLLQCIMCAALRVSPCRN